MHCLFCQLSTTVLRDGQPTDIDSNVGALAAVHHANISDPGDSWETGVLIYNSDDTSNSSDPGTHISIALNNVQPPVGNSELCENFVFSHVIIFLRKRITDTRYGSPNQNKTSFKTSGQRQERNGWETFCALSRASSVLHLRLTMPLRGRNISRPFLSCLCLDVLKKLFLLLNLQSKLKKSVGSVADRTHGLRISAPTLPLF